MTLADLITADVTATTDLDAAHKALNEASANVSTATDAKTKADTDLTAALQTHQHVRMPDGSIWELGPDGKPTSYTPEDATAVTL